MDATIVGPSISNYDGYADVTGRLVSVEAPPLFDGVAGIGDVKKQVKAILGRDGGESGTLFQECERP